MAWTAPRTWVTSEVPTAAIMNTHIRDNLNEVETAKVTAAGMTVWSTGANALAGVYASKPKTAASTWNNTTTLSAVSSFDFPIANGEKWLARYFIETTSSQGGAYGFSIGWTYPSAAAAWCNWFVSGSVPAAQASEGPYSNNLAASGSSSFTVTLPSTTQPLVIYLFISATAAGTVQMIAAQTIATVQNDSFSTNSCMTLHRLA